MPSFFIPFTITVGIVVIGIAYHLTEKKKWKHRADMRLSELQRLHNNELSQIQSALAKAKKELDEAYRRTQELTEKK